jgi:hypothetical protein
MLDLTQIHERNFESEALRLFRHQATHNPVYAKFCALLQRDPERINCIEEIPFLPVELFKNHEVKTGNWTEEKIFTSSTTTGGTPSKHFVRKLAHYERTYTLGFEQAYGPIEEWTILALLPSYLEREGSSLVDMAEGLIRKSTDRRSGFYLYNFDELEALLHQLQAEGKQTLLLGVTFGLLDFCDALEGRKINFPMLRIMETGGMKGRKKEMIRTEVHQYLRSTFSTSPIDSEYGMTELMSQAYLKDSGLFEAPAWMRVYTRDIADPLGTPLRNGSRGALQIIDLANLNSCAFLALSDQGQVFENGTFEVYGRLDHSEIRGCNLMISL